MGIIGPNQIFPCLCVILVVVIPEASGNVLRSRFRDGAGCQSGSHWSAWIDRQSAGSRGQPGVEHESMTTLELQQFCGSGQITDVQCYHGDRSHTELGQNVTCSIQDGLVCKDVDNTPDGCKDYKIRYYCNCQPASLGRYERAATNLPASCNHWTAWVNTHTPTPSDPHDREVFNLTRLQALCPLQQGASISKHQCRDEKGEPFKGFKATKEFNVSCEQNITTCTPVANHTCADIQVQLMCSCPANLGTSATTHTVPTGTRYVNVGPRDAPEALTGTNEDVHIFGKTISVCVLIIIICAVLTLCHCGVTIGLYRTLSNKLEHEKGNRITPVSSMELI